MSSRGVLAVAAVVVAAGLSAVPASGASAAIPGCPTDFPDAQTYVWKSSVADGVWTKDGDVADSNWIVPSGYPKAPDDEGDPTRPAYACIPTGVTVRLGDGDFTNYVRALYLAPGATLVIKLGTHLFAMSRTVDSTAGTGSEIQVAGGGSLGGEGTLRTSGKVVLTGSATAAPILGSNFSSNTPDPAFAGLLSIEPTGSLELPAYGVNLWRRYQVEVKGVAKLSGTGFFAVGDSSRLTVQPGGTLEFAGTGGFYDGTARSDPTPLLNAGTVRKTGPSTVVIGTPYAETGAGTTVVEGGTLAYAYGTPDPASVAAQQRVSTSTCVLPLSGNQPCDIETNPAKDAQSVRLQTPAGAPSTAVEVRELGALDFDAHAEQLPATRSDPAIIRFRLGAALVGTTDPARVGVIHDNEAADLPNCSGSTIPAGLTNCVDRALGSYDALTGNVYVYVRSIDTSRYVCHRIDLPPPPPPPVALAVSAFADWSKLRKPIRTTVTSNQSGSASVTVLVTAKKRKPVTLTSSVSVAAGQPASVPVQLSRKQRGKLEGARKVRASVTVTVTTASGTKTTTASIRLSG